MLRRTISGLLIAAAIFCFIALIVAGSLIAYGLRHSDSVFSGTNSAGVELGGKSVAQATGTLEQRFSAYSTEPIEFTLDDTTIQATPAELGVQFDASATAREAYDFGRRDSLWVESRNWLDAVAGGHTIAPVFSVDADQFADFMAAHGSKLAIPPRDATFVLGADGQPAIDYGASGVGVDLAATFERFTDRVRSMSSEPVEIVTVTVPPAAVDPQMQGALDDVQRLAGDSLQLNLDGNTWEIPASDLFAMLHIVREEERIAVSVDESELRSYVESLTTETYRAGTDASIRNEGGKFVVVKGTAGHRLDVDATVAAAVAALERGDTNVELTTSPVDPHVTDADVATVKESLDKLLAGPLTLTWDGGTATVAPEKIAKAVRFDINSSRNPKITYSLDGEEMRKALALIANDVALTPRDADLRWDGGSAVVRTPEVVGRELDVAATSGAILQAMQAGTNTTAVITKDVQPAVTSATAASIQIRDKLSHSQTEYGSSSPDRLHNVELAASRASGALVAPGGVFSFNKAVGEVSFSSGYRTGYGLLSENGNIMTIPSVGGGICQVATTVFQAAFWAGMPIVERSWHFYWIPRYGQPPTGMKGLDATVDADYGLDFQFKNTTNDWITVVSSFNGSYLTFEIWGTNPGWEVTADQPVITNIRPANHEMVYEENDQLPRGTTVFVEHAEDGFDAAIHRVVRKDGQVIDEVTLYSTYTPARNVTLVGTGN